MEATFKARARTLDMLGRQQIAGIPTAISELFKNAHDAYADTVEIDFYRSDRLFVLRDDGVGMTRDQFVDRWLTIATESRVKGPGARRGVPAFPGQAKRPVLGEKGIGRLAIATIAPQVLVLTRAWKDGDLSDLTAAFVNWRLFECPELNLQDIRIPVSTFPSGTLPSRADIDDMVESFRRSHAHLRNDIGEEPWERIEDELARFEVDPRDIDSYLGSPSLAGEGHGTHFILLPASDRLVDDIEGDPDLRTAPPLKKALLGFANPLGHRNPVIETAFRDHKTDLVPDDLIGHGEFFTPDEYGNADHQVRGRFDEYGQFQGLVSIYGEPVDRHVINWRSRRGLPTECGPFEITFAAIEGRAAYSTLPWNDHGRIIQKTEKIGGLYLYRDGIRILPYGDTDYDWLGIEFRRTKSARYYYFSHRKMFGVVAIDSTNNARLREKAGREGFQENKAYRQLRSILRAFFVQIAADFSREEGSHGERFAARKSELQQEEAHRRRRARQAYAKRQQLALDLEKFFQHTDADQPREEAVQLGMAVEAQLAEAARIPDRSQTARAILEIERQAREDLGQLESRYRLSKPRVGLSKAMQKEWRDYTAMVADITDNVIPETRDLIDHLIADAVADTGIDIAPRIRIDAALKELAAQATRETRGGRKIIRDEVENLSSSISELTYRCMKDVESAIRTVRADFSRLDLSGMDGQDFAKTRDSLETPIREVLQRCSQLLESVRSQLAAIDLTGQSSTLDQLAAVEQSNVTLREEATADLQLAQLGMAIGIINHEFGATVRSVRNGLRSLKVWADVNEELQSVYHSIRANFDHLDGYLTLFTPLHRRLYRKPVDIRGSEIYEFLDDLFRERMARHSVEMVQTTSFEKAIVTGYPSSFYPVFVNLSDNAIYWLSVQNERAERRITLDAKDGVFRVSDTGPGIHRRDRDDIFEYGFTRKPGGRGMGLHISRQALRSVGYDLTLADPEEDAGATFLIGPLRDDEGKADAD